MRLRAPQQGAVVAAGHERHAAALLRTLAGDFVPNRAKREGWGASRRGGKHQHPLTLAGLDTVRVSDLILRVRKPGAFGWGFRGSGCSGWRGRRARLENRLGGPEPVKGMRPAFKNPKA